MGEDRLPFDDGSVDLVFTYHTLEHVPDLLHALEEIARVLKPGGLLLVGVPYVTSTEFHLVNPYHLHNFNEHFFRFFDDLQGSAAEDDRIQLSQTWIRYHYMGLFKLLPGPLKRWCRRHLFNVVNRIDLAVVKGRGATAPDQEAVAQLFERCFRSRVPYDGVSPRSSV